MPNTRLKSKMPTEGKGTPRCSTPQQLITKYAANIEKSQATSTSSSSVPDQVNPHATQAPPEAGEALKSKSIEVEVQIHNPCLDAALDIPENDVQVNQAFNNSNSNKQLPHDLVIDLNSSELNGFASTSMNEQPNSILPSIVDLSVDLSQLETSVISVGTYPPPLRAPQVKYDSDVHLVVFEKMAQTLTTMTTLLEAQKSTIDYLKTRVEDNQSQTNKNFAQMRQLFANTEKRMALVEDKTDEVLKSQKTTQSSLAQVQKDSAKLVKTLTALDTRILTLSGEFAKNKQLEQNESKKLKPALNPNAVEFCTATKQVISSHISTKNTSLSTKTRQSQSTSDFSVQSPPQFCSYSLYILPLFWHEDGFEKRSFNLPYLLALCKLNPVLRNLVKEDIRYWKYLSLQDGKALVRICCKSSTVKDLIWSQVDFFLAKGFEITQVNIMNIVPSQSNLSSPNNRTARSTLRPASKRKSITPEHLNCSSSPKRLMHRTSHNEEIFVEERFGESKRASSISDVLLNLLQFAFPHQRCNSLVIPVEITS